MAVAVEQQRFQAYRSITLASQTPISIIAHTQCKAYPLKAEGGHAVKL